MKNIILVLGAGASHDFEKGMGLGLTLYQEICDRVWEEKNPYLTEILIGLGFKQKELKDFQDKMKAFKVINPNPSIDAFLNKYNTDNFQRIGSFAIAAHVLGYEQECLKTAAFNQKSWLDELCNTIVEHKLQSTSPDFNFNIVTFNYDRLLEEFLFRRYGQVVELFAEKNILHIYEKISNLPWQHGILKETADENKIAIKTGGKIKPLPFLDFGHPNYDAKRIKEREQEILLMYQPRSEYKNIGKVQELIQKADCVLFMGFGYDEFNLKNLGLKVENLKRNEKKIFITNEFVADWTNDSMERFKKREKELSGIFFGRNKTTGDRCKDFIRIWLPRAIEFDKKVFHEKYIIN